MAAGVEFEAFPHVGWDDFRHRGPIRDDEDPWELENRDLEGLPDLRQESPRVRAYLERYVAKYADCGVDGLRWDAVKHMPPWFFRDHANPWAAARGLFTVGEVLHGSVSSCERYLETRSTSSCASRRSVGTATSVRWTVPAWLTATRIDR
jgi:alpha-amylase